jgi:hypothetical protein
MRNVPPYSSAREQRIHAGETSLPPLTATASHHLIVDGGALHIAKRQLGERSQQKAVAAAVHPSGLSDRDPRQIVG